MSGKPNFKKDTDIHITYEDQQKINQFASLNAKWEDLKEEIKQKENDFKNLEEACEEIVLLDDEEKIPYLIGEVFIHQNKEAMEKRLEEAKEKLTKEIENLKENVIKNKETMEDLKTYLYATFDGNINLESEDD